MPLNEPVWVRAVWEHEDGLQREEKIPARVMDRIGPFAHCYWYEPRANTDFFWMHADDLEPRVTDTAPG